MMKVFLNTEFTPASFNALDTLLGILRSPPTPIKILVVNTYIVQQTDPDRVIASNDEQKRKSKAALEEKMARVSQSNPNPQITFETISHMGSLHNVIAQLASKNELDLVVIAREDVKQIEAIEAILKKCQCPLLIT